MRLQIFSVAHKLPDWLENGIQEYSKRMPREFNFSIIEIKPEKRVGGKTALQIMEAEKQRLQAVLPSQSFIIALDERGANWTTVKLSENMQTWLQSGQDISLIIGGADGLHPDIKNNARQLLQLSAMTLPHGMARLLLVEQLYRAWTVLNHHPYHRE